MAFWCAGTKISHPEHLKLSIHMLDGLVYRSLRQNGIMSSVLNKSIVLVLNKSWQAINVRTPAEVFPQLANNVATALDVQGEEMIRPVGWDEWITLPVREQDQAVHTVRASLLNSMPTARPTASRRTGTSTRSSLPNTAANTPVDNAAASPISPVKAADARTPARNLGC